MIPQEPGSGLGLWSAAGEDPPGQAFPPLCSVSAASLHSLFSITHLFTAHLTCLAQSSTLLSLRLPSQSWTWHLIKSGQKKTKMLGCEESSASKALGPAPSVPLELPSQGREDTREGSMVYQDFLWEGAARAAPARCQRNHCTGHCTQCTWPLLGAQTPECKEAEGKGCVLHIKPQGL